jgi:nitroimidazol reductase NimA-like FMN-containing flavoprotein (pyridoxamine 5'-phosphate oxidase superfamily)
MRQEIYDVIGNVKVGCLATITADGSPWITPLHIAIDENTCYWLSSPQAEHSQNIRRNDRVSISIWSPDESEGLRGVYINSTARQLEGAEDQVARSVYQNQLGQLLYKKLSELTMYSAVIGELNTRKTVDNCKYFNSDKTLQVAYNKKE